VSSHTNVIHEHHDVALQSRELARLESRLGERSQECVDLLAAATAALEEGRAASEQRDRETAAKTKGEREQAQVECLTALARAHRKSRDLIDTALGRWSSVMASGTWSDARWAASDGGDLPDGAVRVGTIDGQGPMQGVPAMVPALGTGHLAFVADTDVERARAVQSLDGVLLRLIASAAPGRVRFRIHDPVGIGATLGAYSQFDRQRVARGNPTSTSRELEEVIEFMSAHATEMSATYLRGVHRRFRDYLAEDPYCDVGFEVLVLLDVPSGIDPPMLERISVLARQAAPRGIAILTLQSGSKPGIDLGPDSIAIHVQQDGRARIPALTSAPVRLDPPAPSALLRRIAGRTVLGRSALLYETLHAGAAETCSSAEGVQTPIGRCGRETVALRFGDNPVHGLVAGTTGSGKSNLLRGFVYGLARRYDASELQLYLLDFKEGVEFQEFASTTPDRSFLPQAAVVAVNSSREFGLEVLRHLNKVIADRYALFTSAGSAPKLGSLRAKRDDLLLPRIVLVVDEFQRMFDVDDALSDRAVDELGNIARQGRAAGVHFLLATQSIGDVGAGTAVGVRLDGIFRNSVLRVGMRLSESESREVFSSSTNTAAATIHEQGVAVVNESGGAEAFNQRTVISLLTEHTALAERQAAVMRTRTGRIPPRTFNGAEGADPAANRALRAAVRGRAGDELWETWPAQLLSVGGDEPRHATGVAMSLSRDARRNLAVIGIGAANAAAILQWSVVGLAAARAGARYVLVDLMRTEDSAQYGVPAGLVAATATALKRLGVRPEIVNSGQAADLVSLLARDSGEEPVVVALLGGFERLRGRGEHPDPDDYETAEELLRTRMIDGSNQHVHVLASFSTHDDFEAIDRGQVFGLRAYLQLPAPALMSLTGADLVAPAGRLALWHDLLLGAAPEPVHCYAPFGVADLPAWVTR
jgi:hypothetical protein